MNQFNFNRLFTLLATTAVVIGVIAGFWFLGSPQKQRLLRADQRRVEDLLAIAQRLHIQAQKSQNGSKSVNLPTSLSPLDRKTDPVSGKVYEYKRLSGSRYQLCAQFAIDSTKEQLRDYRQLGPDFWQHPSGRHCFQLDALKEPTPVN